MATVSTATGLVADVAESVLSGIWNKLVQVVTIIRSLPQAVDDMDTQVQRLKGIIDHIKGDLATKQRNAYPEVRNWLEKADVAIDSSESITNEYQQHKNCLGCCPNCVCRYRISKHIRAWRLNVDQLHLEKQSDFPPSGEYGEPTPRNRVLIQIPGFVGNVIEAAQTKLERALFTEDTDIRVIGVYGMGGVGKTSLLQRINNSDKVSELFAPIIWLTISRDYKILDLQDRIAKRLGLQLPEGSDLELRTHELYSSLKDKKFMLILDDMWSPLELKDLGVPLHDTSCKIVLSTRSREVCTAMNAVEIQVNLLPKEYAWQLFCEAAFGNGNVPQEKEDVARKIARECQGLPLAIKVIAAAMKNIPDWDLALQQMQTVDKTFYEVENEIEEKLFQRLQWSYDALTDQLKKCFEYFAAYPEDRQILCEDVTDIWIAQGLVTASENIYLPDIAHTLINSLKDRCLIEVVETDEVGSIQQVKIHDVLRDLAIRIAEGEGRCYFKAGQGVSRFPVEEEIDGKVCEGMSLISNNLRSLPMTFTCSSLSVLLLSGNLDIMEVPGSFLCELPSLRVLDLSYTGITSLPASVGNLKQLVSLQLAQTRICELPETIGDLKELQFLNLQFCIKLSRLPERISELKRMRALNIVGTGLRHLPRGISELVSLERLVMFWSISLDFEDTNGERKYACLEDLQNLCRLRVFSVEMKSTVTSGVMRNWSKIRYLHVACANQRYLPEDMQAMKSLERLELQRCDLERLPSWVSEFQKLAMVQLLQCHQLKELPAELQELPYLKVLIIEDCDKLVKVELGMGFQKLEYLALRWSDSLECVRAEGPSPLPTLKSLTVFSCRKLERLVGRWDKLKCLEKIFGEREWWDEILKWEDPNMRTSLESKFRSL